MTPSLVFVSVIAYVFPLLFIFYMGVDVLLRNPRKTEHRIFAAINACYFLIILEEFVRFYLPIEYSPVLTAIWFSSAGIAIPGLGVQFIVKTVGLDKRMPKLLYPYIFYAPLLIIPFNILGSERYISTQQFVMAGIWKLPVYNTAYYAALTVSLTISAISIWIMYKNLKAAISAEQRAMYNLLLASVCMTFAWIVVFGYFNYGKWLPPYPYLYGGIVWCFFLRLIMNKYEFLDQGIQRYRKIFNISPSALFLLGRNGEVKEVNPAAKQLLAELDMPLDGVVAVKRLELQPLLNKQEEIRNLEATLQNGEKQAELLIDGDYITMDNELQVILIIRNITQQKENQRQIAFLAYHDPLTGLPNRRYFYERLEQSLEEATQAKQQLAVVLIDLNKFKETNDRYGHEAGDTLLKHASQLIVQALGTQGMAARLGGDEFVFYINPLPDVSVVDAVLDQIRALFAQVGIAYKNKLLYAEMSAGVSIFPSDGLSIDQIVNRADKAMYENKKKRA